MHTQFFIILCHNMSTEMERLQKCALRIIQPDLSYAEALVALDITSLYERRKALSNALFDQIVRDQSHKSMICCRHATYCTRSQRYFKLPICKTNRFKMNTATMSLFRPRDLDNVHLVNFFQLTLKSKNDFDAAFDLVLSTKLSENLKLFLISQPGDWPAQFYSRQVIYETLQKICCPFDVFDNPQVCPTDHSYARVCSSGPIQQQMNFSTSGQPGILSIIPRIGPLHISLNGRETVFHDYRQFFETVYNNLFPKSKLAKNPKPWRISLILEVVYSEWFFIRDSVKSKFCFCKDFEYRTLFNLIDNYLPLVLSIYSVT